MNSLKDIPAAIPSLIDAAVAAFDMAMDLADLTNVSVGQLEAAQR